MIVHGLHVDAPPQAITTSPESHGLFCAGCGYDLRAIASERCPECGLVVDRTVAAESAIPWAHRRRIGRVRAYWRTVRLAVFHPRKLAAEVARPVSYFDAQLFRWVTILVVFVPLVVAGIVDMGVTDTTQVGAALGAPPEVARWAEPLMLFGWLCALILITGVPSYFFHPRSIPVIRQNRAVALSYYGCAALGPAAALFYAYIGLGLLLGYFASDALTRVSMPILMALILMQIAAGLFAVTFVVETAILLRRTTGCGVGRQIAFAATHLVSLAVVGPLLVIGLPGFIGFVLVLWRG